MCELPDLVVSPGQMYSICEEVWTCAYVSVHVYYLLCVCSVKYVCVHIVWFHVCVLPVQDPFPLLLWGNPVYENMCVQKM